MTQFSPLDVCQQHTDIHKAGTMVEIALGGVGEGDYTSYCYGAPYCSSCSTLIASTCRIKLKQSGKGLILKAFRSVINSLCLLCDETGGSVCDGFFLWKPGGAVETEVRHFHIFVETQHETLSRL